MKHRIDPKVDCVFKALLGSVKNKALLLHFLNAILSSTGKTRITQVDIVNPYNDKEFISDKCSIVDVKAIDETGRRFQIEIQIAVYSELIPRVVYGWSDLYSSQIQSGDDYIELKPVVSIWLLDGELINAQGFHHHFTLYDQQRNTQLSDHCSIHLIELPKYDKQDIDNELERWTRFFKDGETLDDEQLPDFMLTEEMQQAMTTLRQFSEKEQEYHQYQARMNYVREQRSIKNELERERAEKERERAEKQAALQREQLALQEKDAALQREQVAIEREKALLLEIERLKQK